MSEKKPDRSRTDIALVVTILLGIGLGLFIKRLPLGLLLGLVIGLTASAMMRSR